MAAYECCKHFHPIIQGHLVLVRSDHKNLQFTDAKHTNLQVIQTRLALDQEYQANIKHYPGNLNLGADGLIRLPFHYKIPERCLSEVYSIDKLDRFNNDKFPLNIGMLQAEQEKDTDLQRLLSTRKFREHFDVQIFDGVSVHTFKSKIWVAKRAVLNHRLVPHKS